VAWMDIIMYASPRDADLLRRFINDATEVMWIAKVSERECVYEWRAVDELDCLPEGDHAIWHKASGAINIPSGSLQVPDAVVTDPYSGWTQVLDRAGSTKPWFGANPAPIFLHVRYGGREDPNLIGRSELAWAADHFRAIGKPAAPEAKRWWQTLRSFVRNHATAQEWLPGSKSNIKAYVFPDALEHVAKGASLDADYW
jgi:hypothetical protein